MPVFVHLTSHRNLKAIRRTGLTPGGSAGRSRGVYALPVTRNFQISHQWLRELRRQGGGSIYGVYFRLPDGEPVQIGLYSGVHREVSAAEAVALMLAAEQRDPESGRAADAERSPSARRRSLPSSPQGFEVIVPRAIAPSEILRVKSLPQTVGWRYRPGANGTRPAACLWAERGTWGLRRLERAVEEAEAAGQRPKISLFSRDVSASRRAGRIKVGKERKRPGP